jgi:uncharacterized protein (TIGR03437 family)
LFLAPNLFSANLSYSTYLKDGFTPTAMTADAQGNLYIAGAAITDPVAGTRSAVVIKLDPNASSFQYLVYLDSVTYDYIGAIAVDSSGNAYLTGYTLNPNFPATGGQLGTPSAGPSDTRPPDTRPFVTKLGLDGAVIFSVLVGGSTGSMGEAIALTPQGQILISGICSANGFPVTQGAYSVPNSNGHPFLMELDATATRVIFSATGIGGNSLALDGSGNIYVSGSTTLVDYPTTPGAYQTTFTPSFICYGFCQLGLPGAQQYVTKVDPAASRLIYSTGINQVTTADSFGSNSNSGLAVDAAGNAYVTGVLQGRTYPFTVALPSNAPFEFGYLSKLDPAGSNLLYSIPVGGAGVQIDSSGAVYTAGAVTNYSASLTAPTTPATPPTPLSWVPSLCLPNNLSTISEAYVMKLDPASGKVLDTQWIDGASLNALQVTLASGKAWLTGATQFADVPITPGAMSPAGLVIGTLPGAYLSAVDFTQPADSAPQVACLLDGGNLTHAGPVSANQLLAIMGAGFGTNATVTFDGNPAQVLYASPTQINVAVPMSMVRQKTTVMQIAANGETSALRQLPVIAANPELFADLSTVGTACPQGLALLATNADGTRNTCTNPAKLGSVVSVYVEGAAACLCFDAALGSLSTPVVNVVPLNSFVTQVDIQLPGTFASASGYNDTQGFFSFTIRANNAPVGPLQTGNNMLTLYGAK